MLNMRWGQLCRFIARDFKPRSTDRDNPTYQKKIPQAPPQTSTQTYPPLSPPFTLASRLIPAFKMAASSPNPLKRKLHGYEFYRSIGSPKYVIAPMVDQSELAWRLMSRQPVPPPSYRNPDPSYKLSAKALEFYKSLDTHPSLQEHEQQQSEASSSKTPLGGADLCYTPMIHAKTFLDSAEHSKMKYVGEVFNLSEGEEGSAEKLAGLDVSDRTLFVQFCANDPETLLAAAKVIEHQCDAVDINFGCPQNIARRGKYGSFLQDEWDLIYKLINILHLNLNIPVTAKFRIFPDVKKTIEYALMMESAGASILTCHGRTRDMKGQLSGLADWQQIKAVKEAVKIPVFANGNILYREDVDECIRLTGCDGVMTAEGNLSNPAILIPSESSLSHYPVDVMATYYLDIVCRLKTLTAGSAIKAHLFRILRPALDKYTDLRNRLGSMNTFDLTVFRDLISEVSDRIAADQESDPIPSFPIPKNSNGLKTIPCWASQPYVRAPPVKIMTAEEKALATDAATNDAINGTTGEDRVIDGAPEQPEYILCKVEGCRNISAALCPRSACLVHCRAEGILDNKKASTMEDALKLTYSGKSHDDGCEPHEEKDRMRKERKAEQRISKSKLRDERRGIIRENKAEQQLQQQARKRQKLANGLAAEVSV